MENRYLSERYIPARCTMDWARKGCKWLLSMTFPALMMRKVDRTCGCVRLPDCETRIRTEFVPPSPAKVYPCAAAMQSSRFWV